MSVKDTGAALNPEHLAQLFHAFNRLGQEAGGEFMEVLDAALKLAGQKVEKSNEYSHR